MNKKGVQKFFVDISTNSSKYNSVTEAKAMLSSKDSDFYTNPTISVTEGDLNKANCGSSCVIIITIYSDQKASSDV